MSKFHPTGALDVEASFIASVDCKEFEKGTRSQAELRAFLNTLGITSHFSPETTIEQNENFSDAWAVIFDKKNHRGLFVTTSTDPELNGVWLVKSSTYPWKSIVGLDLICSVDKDHVLKLETLK